MPNNNKRRRFSVNNNLGGSNVNHHHTGKCDSNLQIGQSQTEIWFSSSTTIQTSASMALINEHETFDSASTDDKNVSANSSTIKFYNTLSKIQDGSLEKAIDRIQNETHRSRDRKSSRPAKRDKHVHRAHVRSPRRKVPVIIPRSESLNRSIGTSSFHKASFSTIPKGDKAQKLMEDTNSSIGETSQNLSMSRRSSHSLDDMCRICHGGGGLSQELGSLISACMCRGTVGRVHVKCLERWLTESGKSKCELCGTRYMTRRVHRYGVPRGLVMWILSQNAKQLLVDSLGIMLMSPLAVLAAWLSGRTLAGLMTQDAHVTPWPLASTFVLACMTLVCYYCWIVSAATRHALGWWVWYRSQYEVRLTIEDQDAFS